MVDVSTTVSDVTALLEGNANSRGVALVSDMSGVTGHVELHEDSLRLGARIFEPFFSTKDDLDTGGLGLGLSITKGVVESMGGVLSYESEINKGTTFQVVIPVNQNNKEQ